MIIDELRHEVKEALRSYLALTPEDKTTEYQNTKTLRIINILKEEDPIIVCEKLKHYLDELTLPFLGWIPFLESNILTRHIRPVLNQEKYLERNLFRSLLQEKEYIIAKLQQNNIQTTHHDSELNQKLEAIIQDLTLLKKENEFLYERLASFDQKIKWLEAENTKILKRAHLAEKTLTEYNKATPAKEALETGNHLYGYFGKLACKS